MMNENHIDIAIKALEDLKTEQALRRVAEAQLDAQKNKVLFADAVSASGECILVRELAVMLKQCGVEIGQDRLFDWLRGNGYVYRQPGGRNLPTQHSVELGVLELKKQAPVLTSYGTCTDPNGKELPLTKELPFIHAVQNYFHWEYNNLSDHRRQILFAPYQ